MMQTTQTAPPTSVGLPTSRAGSQRSVPRRALRVGLPHVLLICLSILFLVPFYWMLVSSLKTNQTVFSQPLQWIPKPAHWENYLTVLRYPNFPFLTFLWNSTFYAIGSTIGTVLSCALVGYGFARLRFPGREALFYITLAVQMIPGIVTFIPTYILFKSVGMIGNYTPLILPTFGGSAFYIFMMRQFFRGLPAELGDAAKVDGAGEFRTFWQIMLPLVKPALLVTAVFTFLGAWHDFVNPLIYLADNSLYPLSLGLYAFRAQRTTEWAYMMAAATLATLPLIILFFFTQRYFLEGIKLSGLKG